MATTKFIDIKIRSKSAEAKVNKLDKGMRGLGDTADKTTKSFGVLSKVAAAVGTALSVQQLLRYADAFSSIQNQVRQTTKSTEELTKTTSELLGVANRSRVEFQATAELYTQLNLSTENLNLSTEELLRLTETIGKSFAVSGKSAAESAGAIRQLGQAFSAGALRGDEFNSIAEGAPEIMRALQRSLGKTQGELRDFAATGGITAEILVEALGNAADIIDDKMSKATKTFAQSIQEANNNMTEFIGNSSTVKNIVGGAGEAIVTASENIDLIAKSAVILSSVFAARLIPSIITYTSSVIANTQAQLLNGTAATRTANVYGVVSVAQARATITTNALTVASRALSASMALVGGPLGVALIAAVALVTLSDSIKGVGDESSLSAVEVDEFTESIEGLTRATKSKLLGDINDEMAELRTQLISSSEKLAQFQGFADSPIKTTQVNRYKAEIADLNNKLDLLSEKQGLILGAPDLSGGTDRGDINEPVDDVGGVKDDSARLQSIKDSFKTESQLLFEKFEADKLILDQEVLDKQERYDLSLQLALQYSENLTAIEQDGIDDRTKLEIDGNNRILAAKQASQNAALGLLSVFAAKSKTAAIALLAVQKGLAAAQAWTGALAGSAKVYGELPYPAAVAASAQILAQGKLTVGLIAATGLAQASSISSGGGNVSSSSSIGGSASLNQGQQPTQSPPVQQRVVDIRTDGSAFSEAVKDAALVLFNGGDEDVVVNITNAQSELVRTGVL